MRFLQMYTSYPSGSDSLRNYYGPSCSSAPSTQLSASALLPLPPQPQPLVTPCNLFSPSLASNLMSTNTTSNLGLNAISPLPTRRFSYSGAFPSSTSIHESMMNLAMPSQDTNITCLINETCQSISRSSNILNRQLSADMASQSCTSLSNLIEENVESDIVKYDLLNDITTTATMAPLKYSTNFYSHARHLPCVPPTAASTSSYFNRNPSHYLSDEDYILSKPVFSKNLDTLVSSYINDDYKYAEPLHTYTQNTIPPHYHTFTPSQHYASNPCLSSNSYSFQNYYPPHNNLSNTNNSYTHHPMSSAFNRNYYQSHHQQAFSSSRPPSISSLNRYTALSNNYSSSFNAQPYYRTSSRLDLDNPNKNSEIKRQVSFKFDVDQMSFDP